MWLWLRRFRLLDKIRNRRGTLRRHCPSHMKHSSFLRSRTPPLSASVFRFLPIQLEGSSCAFANLAQMLLLPRRNRQPPSSGGSLPLRASQAPTMASKPEPEASRHNESHIRSKRPFRPNRPSHLCLEGLSCLLRQLTSALSLRRPRIRLLAHNYTLHAIRLH